MWETKVKEIRESLIESFIHLPEEKLNEKPSPEEWSIAQIVLHLAGAETRFLQLAFEAAEAETNIRGEEVDLSVFDDPSKKLKAPIEPSSNPKSSADLMKAIEESREWTDRFLLSYSQTELADKAMNHHRFGNMPIWQVLELLGKHEQRHIIQIEEVKKKLE